MGNSLIKNFLKKHFAFYLLKDRISPAVQIAQLRLFQDYGRNAAGGSLPHFDDTGFKVFSQFEEDGKLLFLFSILGMGNKTFIDLGSHDGINSNCANLAIHFGWNGLFVDGDKTVIDRGRHIYSKLPDPWRYQPKFAQAMISPKNINSIIGENGFSGEIELLSIDIDGNDYWIWKALEIVQPKVVIIESQVAFGQQNKVTPYTEKITGPQDLLGASNSALVELGKEKGYLLVGTNLYGNNMFFVKNGLAEALLPEIDPKTTLQHPWATEKFIDQKTDN